ncbi:MAG: hypothetical protein K0Q97_556 [Bacillota bacterium]|jgi:hypothetical protein|nr:hypothetical protein [Bacillota bacterium]
MKIIIDRFEGDFAVVELQNKQMVNIPKAIIPPEAVEGDVISIEINKEETAERKNKIKNLMNDLWED